MDLQTVNQKIKGCLVGTFTGKVVIRIVDGEIVSCDAGSPAKPLPYLSGEELQRRIVNTPQPVRRPPEVLEAEAAVEKAQRAWERANDAWLDSTARFRSAERDAYRQASSRNIPVDAFGKCQTPETLAAGAELENAQAEKDARAALLQEARLEADQAVRRWRSGESVAKAGAASA